MTPFFIEIKGFSSISIFNDISIHLYSPSKTCTGKKSYDSFLKGYTFHYTSIISGIVLVNEHDKLEIFSNS